ncbi:MAG: histidine ammonia-lyase [Candidatus Aenigmarchaeota archaeon]|nr:histidine ammonia-lyase [Candidatus Aenigmarchaeota archaeon]
MKIEDLITIAEGRAKLALSADSQKRVAKSRKILEEHIGKEKIIYGVTTGFGPLCLNIVSNHSAERLQRNLIRSHSSGAGNPFSETEVRAMMSITANSLARGFSGIKLETLTSFIKSANAGITPVVPQLGSVGASGDLNPLSHIALALIGEGRVTYNGKVMDSAEALAAADVDKVQLSYKEGLALINSTAAMTGLAALAVHRAELMLNATVAASALAVEALVGISDAFDDRLHRLRPHQGQIVVARQIASLLRGSKLVVTYSEVERKIQKTINMANDISPTDISVQDSYSLRCVPQVLAGVYDIIKYARNVVETEMNSVLDNPIVDASGDMLHGGNFHGQPVAMAMDFLAIAVAEMGILSERQTALVLNQHTNNGLPPFLNKDKAGLNSGLMGMQYLATSCAAENRSMCFPVSVESIPTNAYNQDIVSMGTIAARKALNMLSNLEKILAVELICMAQAVDLRGPEKLAPGTRQIYRKIRLATKPVNEDRPMHQDIENVAQILDKIAM